MFNLNTLTVLMEPSGIEPLTSCVQSRRSPSRAKAPQDLSKLNKKLKYIPFFLRKEVIQPHLPIRLPCYDFTPVINPTFDCSSIRSQASGIINSHGVTGGVYKTRERIHRDILIRDY